MTSGKKLFMDRTHRIKECGTCRKILPFDKFSWHPYYDHPLSYCKLCVAAKTRAYKQKQLELKADKKAYVAHKH